MKYKIIQDTLCFGKDGEILSDVKAELLNIPILLEKGFIEEVKEDGKKWRAEKREEYYYVRDDGLVEKDKDSYSEIENYRYLTGNYFQTYKLAQQKRVRDLAIARVNNRIRELQGGEMSLEEIMGIDISKYEIYFDFNDNQYYSCKYTFSYYISVFLPIRTKEIAQQIIKEHKNDLDLI
ncbi:MAG: hypothetical protein QM532_04145 [Cyanobium sp. MAG06]|nr:hypothetical protein [Cyanobium sp. MAG06]